MHRTTIGSSWVWRVVLCAALVAWAGIDRLGARELLIEAESGETTGQYKVMDCEFTSGGKCVEGLEGDGSLTIPFALEEDGQYTIWQRVYPSFGFDLAVDDMLVTHLNRRPGEWTWQRTGVGLNLTKGKHKLVYNGKEPGRIDKIWITRLDPRDPLRDVGRAGPNTTERQLLISHLSQYYDFNKIFGNHDNSVAYFHTCVISPKDWEIMIKCGSDDSIKIWIDKDLVHNAFFNRRPASPGEDTVYGKLKKGPNDILVKVDNGSSDWELYFLLLDREGIPIPDLSFSDGQGRSSVMAPVWSGIGPFSSGEDRKKGFEADLGPEQKLDFQAEYKQTNNQTNQPNVVKWIQIPASEKAQEQAWAELSRTIVTELMAKKEGAFSYEEKGPALAEPLYRFDEKSLGTVVKTYHVSPQGNDANPGSAEAPWKTITKAAQTLQAGERALVHTAAEEITAPMSLQNIALELDKPDRRPGAYREGTITFVNSGREGAYIHLEAAPGESVVLSGTSFRFGSFKHSYIHLKGFKFDKCDQAIETDGCAHHLVIDDIEITGGRGGIAALAGQYLVFRHVNVHDTERGGIHFGRQGRSGVKQALCEDCILDNNQTGKGEGYDKNNTDGITAEPWTEGLVLRRCRVSRHGDGGVDLKPPGIIVEDCASSGNLHFGFKVWNPTTRLVNCISAWNQRAGINGAPTMINCTIYGNTTAFHIEGDLTWPDPAQIAIKNCIIAENTGEPRFKFDPVKFFFGATRLGNIFFNTGVLSSPEAQKGSMLFPEVQNTPGYIVADPLFMDAEQGDLRLRKGSPAIGIGGGVETGALDHDITGLPRKERVDAGAYQSGAADWLPLPHGGINGAWDKELQGVKDVRKGIPNAAQ